MHLCCLVIWSQWAGLGGSWVKAAAWAASGSAAELPALVGGDKGLGGATGCGAPRRGEALLYLAGGMCQMGRVRLYGNLRWWQSRGRAATGELLFLPVFLL